MNTPITYKEAAEILGIDTQRIRTAVSRNVLTQVPGGRSNKCVYREQVELFLGKPELSKNLLTPEQRQTWEDVAESASPPIYIKPDSPPVPAEYPPFTVGFPARSTLEYMNEQKIGVKVTQTQAGEMVFLPALPDGIDSDDMLQATGESNGLTLLAILVGLLILFFALKKDKKVAARQQAERTIEQIGLEKEDLHTSQRKSIEALRSHPREAQQLRTLLKREDILQV